MFLLGANLRAGMAIVGPLAAQIGVDSGAGVVGASWLISLPLLCFGFFSPAVPALCRRLGMERVIALALAGIATGIGVRVFESAVALWGGTALMGIGLGALNVVMPALLKRDFPRSIGGVTGLYLAVQAVAAAAASSSAIPLARLSDLGWRLPVSIWAVLAVAALTLVIPTLRATRRAREPEETVSLARSRSTWSPWRSTRGWQMAVFMGTQSTVYYVILAAWPLVEERLGASALDAGLHQGAMQVSSVIGILSCSAVLRWMPNDQRPLALLALITASGVTLAFLAPGAILLWNILIGVATGASLVHALALFGLHASDHAQAGRASAMAQSFGYFLAAGGPLIAGLLLQASPGGGGVLALLTALLAVQLLAALLASRSGLVDSISAPRGGALAPAVAGPSS